MKLVRSGVFALALLGTLGGCPDRHNPNLFLDDTAPPDVVTMHQVEPARILETRVARLNAKQFFDKAFEPSSDLKTVYNLFDDLQLDVVATEYASVGTGTVVWHGVDKNGSSVRIAFAIKDRTISGEVLTLTDTIRITPLRDDWHRIDRFNLAGFPEEAEPVNPTVSDAVVVEPLQACDEAGVPTPPPGKVPTTVRILIAFTPEAEADGQDVNVTADWLINQVEDVWMKSSITPIMPELAHVAVLSSSEAGSSLADLTRLRNPADGFYDEVHALRREHRADLVALITSKMNDACGRGYYLYPISAGNAASGFTVTQRTCALAQMTLVHELGHNLGMQHDRESAGSNPQLYNYGHIDHNIKKRSVMAYNSPCGRRGYYCPRYPTYSNPHQIIGKGGILGRSIGEPDAAHNRNMLCSAAPTVARFEH